MKLLFPLGAALLLAACHNSDAPKVGAAQSAPKPSKPVVVNPEVIAGIEGFYTGPFEASEGGDFRTTTRITICIDSVRGNAVYGWSIVGGNRRPFTGTAQHTASEWTFTAREPGNDAHDGTFTGRFIDTTLAGTWTAFNTQTKIPQRNFDLVRRHYHYDPTVMLDNGSNVDFNDVTYDEKRDEGEMLSDAVFKLNASTKALKPADVENLYKADLEILRNTIYARHGYSFRNPRIRAAFDHSVDWYLPVSDDVTAQLTPLERQNIALLTRYEAHATKYYGSFGR